MLVFLLLACITNNAELDRPCDPNSDAIADDDDAFGISPETLVDAVVATAPTVADLDAPNDNLRERDGVPMEWMLQLRSGEAVVLSGSHATCPELLGEDEGPREWLSVPVDLTVTVDDIRIGGKYAIVTERVDTFDRAQTWFALPGLATVTDGAGDGGADGAVLEVGATSQAEIDASSETWTNLSGSVEWNSPLAGELLVDVEGVSSEGHQMTLWWAHTTWAAP